MILIKINTYAASTKKLFMIKRNVFNKSKRLIFRFWPLQLASRKISELTACLKMQNGASKKKGVSLVLC